MLATIPWELLLRIAVGTVLGGIIGYERDIHGRPAGLRTHMIVGLASATFMVVSTNFVYHQHFQHADMVEVDASRIAASIVTGMGFLAGGAILRTGVSVQGLTTAAALWLVGAIGMASGAGMFGVAIFVTVMGVIALTALRRFEDKDSRTTHRHRIDLVLGEEVSTAQISTRLRELGVAVSTVKQERKPEKKTQSLTLDVRVPAEVDFETLVGSLGADPGVRRVRVERVA
ncbi:MAG: MgtC/SapB family protein [Myxococcales bacterium]|nr:MgtC/SapB family protein [Myxococcales bacterium]